MTEGSGCWAQGQPTSAAPCQQQPPQGRVCRCTPHGAGAAGSCCCRACPFLLEGDRLDDALCHCVGAGHPHLYLMVPASPRPQAVPTSLRPADKHPQVVQTRAVCG